MRDFIKRNGLIIIAAAVLVAVIAAVSIAFGSGGSDAAGGTVNNVMRPLRGVMSGIASELENVYGYMYGVDMLKAENEELKTRVAELEREYREYEEMAAENERLYKLLEFEDTHSGYDLTQTTVLSPSASSWQSAFTVSKGTNAGLAVGNCVITEAGFIVGRITSVSKSSAVVTTLIDTTSSIGATVWDTGDSCVLCGDFELMREGRAKLKYLPDACTLAPGDTVTASGSGGVFPRGLVLGTVESVESDASGSGDCAVIVPSAELDSLNYVYVITAFTEE